MKKQGREGEVRQFWKDREQADEIVRSVQEIIPSDYASAKELCDALVESEEFWAKLKEVLLECQPKQKSGRTRRT